jgi:hypothetical protein
LTCFFIFTYYNIFFDNILVIQAGFVMARKRGKMALYEVMSKARARSDAVKTVEPLQPKKKPEKVKLPLAKEPVATEPVVTEPKVATKWRKKPRIIQYNLGRIEFSIPYQLAITVGLALLLLFLLAFRFGQYSGRAGVTQVNEPQVSNAAGSNRAGLTGLANPETIRPPTSDEGRTAANRETAPVAPVGNNVIVLAQYKARSHLVPVQEYFRINKIPTEIVSDGTWYFLQTVQRFVENPSNEGTEGYKMIQKIADIGKNYKAPPSYETFAPNYFSDAYGKKISN